MSDRAVRFDHFGGIDVLHVADVTIPDPGPGEIVVAVRAAGINPGEAAIRAGVFDGGDESGLPSGQGSDFAGVVERVGDEVTGWSPGDDVLGWSWSRSSQATRVVVPADQVIAKPAALSWEVAGSLYVVGVTAWAAVHAVDPAPGETVVVSGAAGGVGTIVVQYLRAKDVSVVGIASQANHDWLRSRGATPVDYGDGLTDRIREVAPDGVDAVIDLFGPQYLDLAVELGVPRERIETIISFDRAAELGTKAEGSQEATSTGVLSEMAGLVADGTIELPVAATYPLQDVRQAFERLEQRHTRGKIVLLP